jgi:hypothetical protein
MTIGYHEEGKMRRDRQKGAPNSRSVCQCVRATCYSRAPALSWIDHGQDEEKRDPRRGERGERLKLKTDTALLNA